MDDNKQQPQPDPVEETYALTQLVTLSPEGTPEPEPAIVYDPGPEITTTNAPVVTPKLPDMPFRPVELEGADALSLSIRNQTFELASRDIGKALRPAIALVEDNAKAIGELSVVSKEAAVVVEKAVAALDTVPGDMVRIDGKLYPKWKCGYYLRESKDFPGFFVDANDQVYEKLKSGALVRRTYKKNERRGN